MDGLKEAFSRENLLKNLNFFALLNLGLVLTAVGIVYFKNPNHFAFGGTSGLSILLADLFPRINVGGFMWIINLILVVLGMFYFVGYNNPVGEYNEPAHTETLIYLMYGMFGVCVAVTLVGAIAQFGAALRDNPMSAVKSLLGIVLLVVVLVVSYSMGSEATIMTGDGPYSDAFWLKITDMLIYSIYCLFGVAAVGTILNLSGIFKK